MQHSQYASLSSACVLLVYGARNFSMLLGFMTSVCWQVSTASDVSMTVLGAMAVSTPLRLEPSLFPSRLGRFDSWLRILDACFSCSRICDCEAMVKIVGEGGGGDNDNDRLSEISRDFERLRRFWRGGFRKWRSGSNFIGSATILDQIVRGLFVIT